MSDVSWTRLADYEEGLMGDGEVLVLFSDLVKSGLAWQLQGHYGRMAWQLQTDGFLRPNGDVNWERWEEVSE